MKIYNFDWDEGNRKKCQKHGLSIEEIEGFFHHGQYRLLPDIKHAEAESRMIALGVGVSEKWIFIGFVLRDGMIRPLTARYMHKKEVRNYEKEEDAPF